MSNQKMRGVWRRGGGEGGINLVTTGLLSSDSLNGNSETPWQPEQAGDDYHANIPSRSGSLILHSSLLSLLSPLLTLSSSDN